MYMFMQAKNTLVIGVMYPLYDSSKFAWGKNQVSETITWFAGAALLSCQRPPTAQSQAEPAYSNPGQLPETTENGEGDAGEIEISNL